MQSWPAPNVPALPGRGPQLRLYDSADRQVRPVTAGETATMYVCGITPYDATHLGHAATYLAFDLVNRVWLDSGHGVHYVQNITDVDDPLFERASRDGVDWRELGDRETAAVPRRHGGAAGAAAARLRGGHRGHRRGHRAGGEDAGLRRGVPSSTTPTTRDVYFRADATAQFGYESGYDRDDHAAVVRRAWRRPRPRRARHDELDALMWRAARPGEPSWPSPFGPGRPGWHVECAAIALNRIGTGLDVQGGGSDLIFPHHEFSAAHAESVTGERRFARHYVHAGMIGWDGAQDEQEPRQPGPRLGACAPTASNRGAIRLGLLAGHYRADRSVERTTVLAEANARLQRWRAATSLPAAPDANDVIARVRQYLADDLDTPKALAALDGWATDALDYGGHDTQAAGTVTSAVDALLGVAL